MKTFIKIIMTIFVSSIALFLVVLWVAGKTIPSGEQGSSTKRLSNSIATYASNDKFLMQCHKLLELTLVTKLQFTDISIPYIEPFNDGDTYIFA